ncbi:antitoxin [Parafilimonas sp.]|uniref:antitoxin n=1 Tax=Parafilimonas sp. TaxID=1969739 RepID=UPI0039E4C6CD
MEFETISIDNSSGSQAIQIPASLKINDDKVYIKKIGNSLYIIPFHKPWQNLFESLDQFTDDFMQARNEPGQQKRDDIFL